MKFAWITLFTIICASCLYSESYYYDDAGRLTQVSYDDGSGITYSYDNNGNILETKPISIPGKPSGLVATTDSGPGIALSWDVSENVESYTIFRRSGSSTLWEDLGTVPSDTVLFFDTTVLGDTEYFYQIVAVGAEGLSVYSDSTEAILDPRAGTFRFKNSGENASGLSYEINFKAESGSNYQFQSSQTLEVDDWNPHAYSVFPEGIETTGTLANASGATKFYFSTVVSDLPIFFRLVQDSE